MNATNRIRVVLTVPHLNRTASPYREMMAIAKHLSRKDFDLSICALRDGGHRETGPLLDRLGVPWFVAAFRPRNRSAREIWRSIQAQREIKRHGPFDIQHSLDFTSSPAEALGARAGGRRYVYNQRNMNENGHPSVLRIKFRLSNRIVSIADHVRRFLVEQGAAASKIVNIRNGIDLEETDRELAVANAEPQNCILVLGQIEPRKRHQDIIRALPFVLTDYPDMRVAIAGNVYHKQYFEELKRLARELGVESKIDFLGARDDVPRLLRQSRALVLCSESEGLPWVILEAMAARLPFVGSDIGAHREVVKHGQTGLLAPLDDPAGYAAAIKRVLSDREFAGRLTAQARTAVEREFSAVTMVRQLELTYLEMMHSETNPHPVNAVPLARTAERAREARLEAE
ncbi:MAG TPA: GT4 family glycosyltransferase PelF [Candidatus Acidoferrales bacterium]|nr:GT4 family glycosyltransferase PelF [Candidatus Acidoferrales bacterium]